MCSEFVTMRKGVNILQFINPVQKMSLDSNRRAFVGFCGGYLLFNSVIPKAEGKSNGEEVTWKMHQRDSLNSGYEPNFSGFGSEVEIEWEVELEEEIYASPSVTSGNYTLLPLPGNYMV